MPTIRNLLVPIDFSDTSRAALRYAAQMADTFRACLHLLYVAPDPVRNPWVLEPALMPVADTCGPLGDEALVALRALATEEQLDPIWTETTVLEGTAHLEILRYAAEHAVDMVIMGTHGHGAIAHLLLGSVAERVVRHARCPVLVVPRVRRAEVIATDALPHTRAHATAYAGVRLS